ncbi:MAG: PH domain-containing protein [Clostridium sp.]|uniref:PH domain-containing protein n=1 Tax=Clostridium sp. TaxID=1506 RepID=UPI0025C0B67F|nr:PH domain-containing protein [Clostridium sp.]MCF0147666.1 PH domain-containing protein [Clostridium sp.]
MTEYEKLNIKAKKSWTISRLIGTLILSSILITIKIFMPKVIDVNDKVNVYFTVGSIILIGLLLINSIVYPIIEYKQWRYTITKDKIEFTEGIFFIRKVIIPIIRIQHIQLNQGPINKILKLYNITIFTAGGLHKIPNIEIKRAEEISEYLKELINVKVQKDTETYENDIVLDEGLKEYDER